MHAYSRPNNGDDVSNRNLSAEPYSVQAITSTIVARRTESEYKSSMIMKCCTCLRLFLLVGSVVASAWRPAERLSSCKAPTNVPNPSGALCKMKPTKFMVSDQVDDNSDTLPPDINPKRLIQIESELKLPFSREVAYDAYSDLTRQPSWSSWLHSVDYIDDEKNNSKWTMKFLKVKYSWTAIALKNQRPCVIQWQSTSGLQNFGIVEFIPSDDENYPTLMTMKMAFVAPRAAAAVFRQSKFMTNFVREKMILDSMLTFRDVVWRNDCKEANS